MLITNIQLTSTNHSLLIIRVDIWNNMGEELINIKIIEVI